MPESPLIPAQQWAQVIEKTGGQAAVNYKQISVQKPESDEVLVHVRYSGVCHTDLHAMLGDWPLKEKRPLVGGHEGAGLVVAIGDQVTSLGVGDHVGIKWINGACHDCTFCHRGEEQLCAQALLSGYTVDGTFQQYTVAKAAYVARIPEECNLEDVAPVLCAGLTVYRGLKESGARPGEYVAVVGAGGGLGCFALQYAHAMGLRCIAVDSGDEKAEICKSLGAEAFIDYEKTRHLGADIKAATHSHVGPHAVLLLATHEEPFQQASKYVRPGGCIVCIGMPGHSFLKASVFDTVVRMVTIKGSYVGNRQDMSEALEFFRRGLIKAPHKLIGLSRLGEVYDLMLKDSVVGRYVLDTSS